MNQLRERDRDSDLVLVLVLVPVSSIAFPTVSCRVRVVRGVEWSWWSA